MRTRTFLAYFGALCSSALALHEEDAGVTDWYKQLIGLPLLHHATLAPRFVSSSNGNSSILLATENNVLAMLNSADGHVAWRHVFDTNEPILKVELDKQNVHVLSGIGGSMIRSFRLSDGHLSWDRMLQPSVLGRLTEPTGAGVDLSVVNDGSKDLLVLSTPPVVRRLAHATGDTVWEWSPAASSSLDLHSRVVSTSSSVFVLSLTKSFASYSLHITALDPLTGAEQSSKPVQSSIKQGVADILFSNLNSDPHVVWLESGALKLLTLETLKTSKVQTKRFVELRSIGQSGKIFSAITEDGAKTFFTIEDEDLKIIASFPSSTSSLDGASTLFGEITSNEFVSIVKSAHDPETQVTLIEVLAPKGISHDIRGPLNIPFSRVVDGTPLYITLDTSAPTLRVLFVTSTGSLHMFTPGASSSTPLSLSWTREESLTRIAAAEFIDLPERQHLHSGSGGSLASESFQVKLVRQIKEARNLPTYLLKFGRRFWTGKYDEDLGLSPEALAGIADGHAKGSGLHRDTFGLQKLLVVTTEHGVAMGIDSRRGDVVWKRILSSDRPRRQIVGEKIWVLKSASETDDVPEVVVLGKNHEAAETILMHLNPLTGDTLLSPDLTSVSHGHKLEEFFFIKGENSSLLALDVNNHVHVYPLSPSSLSSLIPSSPLHFIQTAHTSPTTQRVTGRRISASSSSPLTSQPIWTFTPPAGEAIVHQFRATQNPIASYGKVLGDRGTLYKYLNPHLLGFVTSFSSPLSTSASTGGRSNAIYLIDSVSGKVVYHASVPVEGDALLGNPRRLQVSMTENWLVYIWFDPGKLGDSQGGKGWRAVSVEFYEGTKKDDKTRSSEASSWSYESTEFTPYQNSYLWPHGVTAMSMTSTKFGISSKDLIVANSKGQIQSFSRRLLDPRRHKNKPSASDQEELLIPYDPIIPDDPRHVLSHRNEVLGTTHILTSPSLLESTSLVFTYGTLDLFFTRVAPSGTFDVLSESFNKVQLVATVIGLGVAIAVVRPIVKRKKLRARWYS